MTGRPRVLLAAVGGYGSNYLKEMTERDTGADIAGICEIMPGIEDMFPVIRERRIPVYPTVDDFYAADSADLAVISSPVHFHRAMTLTCLKNGSHVLCEKPLCLRLEEAEELEQAAKAAGKFLAVGYQFNYRRDVLALKRDILAGRFGAPRRLRVVHAMRRGKMYYGRNNWAGHISANGREVLDSPFSNACAHYFQLMTFLLGGDLSGADDVTALDAELYRGNPALENFDIAAMRFRSACGADLYYYTAHPLESKKLGPEGVFEFDNATVTFGPGDGSFRAVLSDGEIIDYGLIPPGNRLQKLDDAIACVKNGGSPVCGPAAEHPHIHAVRMAQEKPVRPVPPENTYLFRAEGDEFLCVRGLERAFEESARAWALPGEIGLALDSI